MGSALAIFTRQATATANTVSAATAFPRCYSDAVLADNPVSYWRLDETSGTSAADSKGSNTGTYTNGVTLGQAGALPDTINNKAASFDGVNDYVTMGNAANLQLTTGTVEAWIKTSNAGAASRDVINKRGAYVLYLRDNVLETYDYSGAGGLSTGVNLADNAWHQVALSFQSGVSNGTKVYVDGVLRLTTITTNTDQTYPLLIGNESGSVEYLAGTIDEASVYSTVLTAAQIRTHYNTGRCYKDGVLADTPLGYWRLGETSGTTATDGIRGRHGSYVNTPTLAAAGALNGDANTAVTFDGSSEYVSVPYDSALNPGQVTLEGWALPTGGAGTARTIVAAQDTNKGYLLGIGTDNKWRFTVGTGAATTVVASSATVTLNSWAHIIGTYDGSTATLYVDGISVGTASVTVSVNTTRPLGIGATDAGGSWAGYFPGSIDEVALYGTALSQTRVQAHYLLGRSYQDSVLDRGPVAYWRLGDPAGATTATDIVGGYDGDNGTSPGQTGALAGDADTSTYVGGAGNRIKLLDDPKARPANITVEAWLKPVTGIADWSGAVVNSSTESRTDGWGLYYSGGTVNFFVNNYSTAGVSAAIALDRWTYVAATYDGSAIRLYVSGAQAASRTYSTAITYVPHSWRIGSGLDAASNTGHCWTGYIDDVALYNRALTATEVQLDYDSGRQ